LRRNWPGRGITIADHFLLFERQDTELSDGGTIKRRGPLKDGTNKTVTEDGEMMDLLNEYFASVFTQEGNGPDKRKRS
jgi:hypothetical protein